MIALVLYFFSMQPTVATSCEQLGPRLDGTYVTVCNGTVVGVRDQLGNSRQWDPATRTVTVRAPGRRPLALN